jgi:hypothetical protein
LCTLVACGGEGGTGPDDEGPTVEPFPGTWSSAAALPVGILDGAATAHGGAIWIAGGATDDSTPTSRTYRYDPGADRWDRLADLPEALRWPKAVSHDGVLLVIGGSPSAQGLSDRNSVQTPADTDGWTLHSALPSPTGRPLAAETAGGTFAVVGPILSTDRVAARLDPGSMEWRTVEADTPPFLPEFLVSDGDVVWAVGGSGLTGALVAEYRAGAWGSTYPLPTSGFLIAAWAMDGVLYVLQREAGTASMAGRAPGATTWTSFAAPTEGIQRTGAMTAVVGGRLFLIGGREATPSGESLTRVDVFTPPS